MHNIYFADALNVKKGRYLPLYTNGSLVIGNDFDGKADKEDFDSGFDPRQGLSGKISQVEIWNTILTSVEIQKLANCHKSSIKFQNLILAWKTEDWKLSGETTIYEIPLKELCQKNVVSNQFIWPRPIDFEKFSSYCNLIDGIPPLIYKSSKKKDEYDEVRDIYLTANKTFPSGFLDRTIPEGIRCFLSKTNSNVHFWTGMKWNQIEEKWYSPFKPFTNFSEFKEEIVSKGSNCGYFYDNTFLSAYCQMKFPCGICEIPEDKLIYLKGLCKDSYDIFDMKYHVYGLKNNRPYFK